MNEAQPKQPVPRNPLPERPTFVQKDGKFYVQYIKGGDYYSLPYIQSPDAILLSSLAKAVAQIDHQKAKRPDAKQPIYIDVAHDTEKAYNPDHVNSDSAFKDYVSVSAPSVPELVLATFEMSQMETPQEQTTSPRAQIDAPPAQIRAPQAAREPDEGPDDESDYTSSGDSDYTSNVDSD